MAVTVFIFFLAPFFFLEPPQLNQDKRFEFIIEKGDGFKEIAANLEKSGLIKSAAWFKIYSLLSGQAQQFKPGRYQLSPSQSSIEVVALLAAGPEDIKLVIQEGETLVDIDRKMAAAGLIAAGELVEYNRLRQLRGEKSLEGFLFPDTYKMAQAAAIEAVVKKILDNFQVKVGTIGYEDLILASLLEKEAAYPEDRVLAAGILKKRLERKMLLQVDAANVYLKCGGAYVTCLKEERQLSRADLKINSPYNTYIYKGLPPTPIANPGKEAILAALNPRSSSYLYYISDPQTGRLVFAKDLDSHNGNRYKYLR